MTLEVEFQATGQVAGDSVGEKGAHSEPFHQI